MSNEAPSFSVQLMFDSMARVLGLPPDWRAPAPERPAPAGWDALENVR